MAQPGRLPTVLLALLGAQATLASDACSPYSLTASAKVAVSDGTTFETTAYFHTLETAAIVHRYPDRPPQIIATEGPTSWVRRGDESMPGSDAHQLFALSHQFHALWLGFDALDPDGATSETILFDGQPRAASKAAFPHGGHVYRVAGDSAERPAGLRFDFPDLPPIEAVFDDWRTGEQGDLPFLITIDDGSRVFRYEFTDVAITDQHSRWFSEALPVPGLDAVQVYRLHRDLLAAHCLGDAALMAELSTAEITMASRGELFTTTPAAVHERFSQVFEAVDYREYHDRTLPVIRIDANAGLGWIAVSTKATGVSRIDEQAFDMDWAWVMLVEKVDGAWRNAGNASNSK